MEFFRNGALLSTLLLCTTMKTLKAFQIRSRQPCVVSAWRTARTRQSLLSESANGQLWTLSIGDAFVSDPMKVFIEDTDCYGVVCNSNYIKFYDRALQSTFSSPSSLADHAVVVAVGNQKFRASPTLGDAFVVEGVLKDVGEAEKQVWDLSLKSLDGSVIYHSAERIEVTRPDDSNWSVDVDPFDSSPQFGVTDSFTAYRDEFDPSMMSHLPLTSVLNHFERPRTNSLGGGYNSFSQPQD